MPDFTEKDKKALEIDPNFGGNGTSLPIYDGGNNQWQGVAYTNPKGTIIGSNRKISQILLLISHTPGWEGHGHERGQVRVHELENTFRTTSGT